MALYKDLKNGQYLCNVCCTQVKAKIWTAHVNGRKHRENVQILKERLVAQVSQQEQQGVKRKAEENMTNTNDSKRSKNGYENLDDDTEIDESQPIKTPWQEEMANLSKASNPPTEKLIEDLPEGFFDNVELNNRLRDTVERQKHLDEEVNKFFNELAEEEKRKVDEDDVEAETSAVQNDIELIDDQIERWRVINELEKRKEELVAEATTSTVIPNSSAVSSTQNPNFNRSVIGARFNDSPEAIEEDDDDFDILDWRTKVL